jgi:hypothetical protein
MLLVLLLVSSAFCCINAQQVIGTHFRNVGLAYCYPNHFVRQVIHSGCSSWWRVYNSIQSCIFATKCIVCIRQHDAKILEARFRPYVADTIEEYDAILRVVSPYTAENVQTINTTPSISVGLPSLAFAIRANVLGLVRFFQREQLNYEKSDAAVNFRNLDSTSSQALKGWKQSTQLRVVLGTLFSSSTRTNPLPLMQMLVTLSAAFSQAERT